MTKQDDGFVISDAREVRDNGVQLVDRLQGAFFQKYGHYYHPCKTASLGEEFTEPVTEPVLTPDPDPQPDPQPDDFYRCVLRLNDGDIITFAPEKFTRLDDYVGPYVTQQCYVQTIGLWTLWLHIETDNVTALIHYGETTSDHTKAVEGPGWVLDLYTDFGEKLGLKPVSRMPWLGQAVWSQKPWKIVRTKDEIKNHPLIPKLYGPINEPKDPQYDGPVTDTEFNPYFPNTGERPGLGLINGWTASYLLGGEIDETDLIELALDFFQAPIHNYEDNKPFDVTKPGNEWRNHHSNNRGRPEYIARHKTARDINVDIAHMPEFMLLPYLLTDQPIFLRELQLICENHMSYSSWHRSGSRNFAGQDLFVFHSQPRAQAWGYRDIFNCLYLMNEITAPNWMLPKDHYQVYLDHFVIEHKAVMDHPHRRYQTFQISPGHSGKDDEPFFSPWMQDMQMAVMMFFVPHFPALESWAGWLLRNAKSRCGPEWNKEFPTVYNFQLPLPSTWGEYWANYEAKYPDRILKGSDLLNPNHYSGYNDYLYGGFVFAEKAGFDVPELDYIEQARNAKIQAGTHVYSKWSFVR